MKPRAPDDRNLTGDEIERQAVPVELPPADDGSDAGEATDPYADRWRTVAEWGDDDASDWLDAEPPRRRYLLSAPDRDDASRFAPLLPLGKVAILAGEGGCGKTMALCQLAVAVAAGVPGGTGSGPRWLDTFRVDTPGRVALLTGEEDATELRRRLWNAVKLMGLDDAARDRVRRNLVAVPLTGLDVALLKAGTDGLALQTDAARALLCRLRGGEGWSLVILDPMSRFEPTGAESDNVTATRFVTACERLTEAPGGPAVLLSHHTSQEARKANDDAATGVRGVTGLTDAARAVFMLRPVRVAGKAVAKMAVLSMSKSNYGPFPPPLLLTRDYEHGAALRAASEGDRAELERMKEEAREAAAAEAAADTVAKAKARAKAKKEADAKGAAEANGGDKPAKGRGPKP